MTHDDGRQTGGRPARRRLEGTERPAPIAMDAEQFRAVGHRLVDQLAALCRSLGLRLELGRLSRRHQKRLVGVQHEKGEENGDQDPAFH